MRVIFDIALYELRILFADRGIWVNLVFIPIVISVAIAVATGGGGSSGGARLRVDVLDDDHSARAEQMLTAVRDANTDIVLCPQDNNEDDVCALGEAALTPELAQKRLEEETSLALIEIPAGFTESLDSGQSGTIRYRSNEDVTAPGYLLQAVQAAAQRVSGAQTAVSVANDVAAGMPYLQFQDEADRAAFSEQVRAEAESLWASNPINVEFVQAAAQEETRSSMNRGFQQSIPGIGSMYVLFTVLPAAAALIRERKTWTLQRLAVLPISRAQILGGKMLSRFLLGMIQYAVMFGFGLVIGVRFGDEPVALILLMIAFSVCVTAMALALTTLLRNEGQAVGITLLLSLTLAPLGGAWWTLDIVPEWMRTIGHISPIAWVMDGFHSLIFFDGSLSTVIVPILALLALAVVFFVYGVMRFKFD
jgi:ABC-2 type transport system permease protein